MLLKKVSCFHVVTILIGLLTSALPAWGNDVDKRQAEEKAALVNGTAITRDEFDREVLRIQGALLGRGKPLTCAQIASVNKEIVESLIRREILYQESRKAGIKIDPKEIDKEIDTLKKQFLSEAEYKNELTRKNLSEDTLRAYLERNLSIQKYVERQFLEKVKVEDGDITAYYESHLYLLKQPLQVRVSHILIQSDTKWEASRKQEARRKAEQILKNLKKGDDFAVLAREHSDGPTRTNGGDLGYIKMGQLEKQFENVVFNLKPGETSGIIETDYGFHLFKVTDRKPESIVAYDSVKEQIRQILRDEKAKQEADLYAKSLREKANVTILLPELAQNPEKQTNTSSR
ncbi:MAG TPA: peptidylprolyl isomerase [Thermodesulfobacteriota bacterium]|nr:peptidylprolyl isomerase [Thermodesulfobacteriota bacterium]